MQPMLTSKTRHFRTLPSSSPSHGNRRLDSWKEIAAFFGRDERTVNRWEKDLGLPVHRLPGTKGRVYAFTYEISAWLAAPKNAGAPLGEQNNESSRGNGQPGAPQPDASASSVTEITAGRSPTETESIESPAREVRNASAQQHPNTIKLLVAAIVFMGVVCLVLVHFIANRAPKTARPI